MTPLLKHLEELEALVNGEREYGFEFVASYPKTVLRLIAALRESIEFYETGSKAGHSHMHPNYCKEKLEIIEKILKGGSDGE